jgi:hypothetical protein
MLVVAVVRSQILLVLLVVPVVVVLVEMLPKQTSAVMEHRVKETLAELVTRRAECSAVAEVVVVQP